MREISLIKQKILQYLDYKGISKYKFYQETGITNGILSQPNGISEDNLLRFLSVYKDISVVWLLTGEGDMIKPETQPNASSNTVPPPSECCEDGVISTLKDIIKEQAKEIVRLEMEVETLKNGTK